MGFCIYIPAYLINFCWKPHIIIKPNSLNFESKPHTHKAPNQKYEKKMPVNNLESFVDYSPPTEADRAWYRIVEEYLSQTIQSEANGRVPKLLKSSEEFGLMLPAEHASQGHTRIPRLRIQNHREIYRKNKFH